jgi:MinD-like ATPase involved in chromosome partitioning or flagellar assembly/FixJ family two-component response regulator
MAQSETDFRILLVEDNPGDVRLFKETLLESIGPRFTVDLAGTLAGALERLALGGLDLAVVDLTLPDSRGFETFTRVYAQAVDLPVIVLTGAHDEGLGVRAVREGAQDYLVKDDVSPSALGRAVVFAIERHRQQVEQIHKAQKAKNRKCISFIGAKGGVGTTTIAFNVASALARDRETALVELSSSPETLSYHTGASPGRTLRSLLDLEVSQINPSEVSSRICKLAQGLQVLFGPRRGEEAKAIDSERAASVLNNLCCLAEYVLIDLPRHHCASTQVAVRMSDFVVLVVNPEPISVAAGEVALESLRAWGLSETLLGVVVNNNGRITNPMKPADIRRELGTQLVAVIPPIPEAYQSSSQAGQPVIFWRPESAVSSALIELAGRLAADPVRLIEL